MSICIYSPNTTDFANNGLGILTPYECTVSKQAAGMWQLKLVHPIDNTFRWAQLQEGFFIKAPCPVRESPEIVEEIIPEGSTETTVTQELYEVVNTSVGARLRKGPGTSYKTIAIKRNGDKVVKLGMSGSSWMKVCVVDGGATGYMSAKYLAPYKTQTETVDKGSGSKVIVPAQSREQLFRIECVEKDTEGGIVTATATHVSYEWMGNLLDEEYAPENDDVQNAISKLKNNLLMESEVELYAGALSGNITADYSYKNPVEILFDPDEGIVKQTGAQVMRDNYKVYLYPDAVRDRGVTIRRGKNLIGVKVNTSDSSVVTRIIPVGRNKHGDPLYLDGQKYIDSPRISDYPTVRARRIEYDVEVGEEFKNDAAAREELRRLVEADYASGIDLPSYGMEVNFIMLQGEGEHENYSALQAVHLYDTVTVIDEIINLKAKLRVTAYEWDTLTEQYISVTLGDLQALQQTVYGYQIPSQSISGNKIINNSVSGNVMRDASIQYAKIAVAAIEQLNANSITAVTAKIQEIVSGKLTTDELYAALAEITALKVGSLTAEDITTDKLAAALATFTVLTAGTAEFDKATVQHLVAQALNLQFGTAEQVFIKNLAVEYAQMVGATIGNLCIKASDGKYYNIDVDASGNVSATPATVSGGEITAGQTSGGRVILDTDITAANLNTSNLLATYALINQIDAARIDVDQLFAREAFITRLTTSNIIAGESLTIVAGKATSAQNAANKAQQDASSASQAANSAQATANSANQTANSASQAAAAAQSAASTASQNAANAKTAANKAQEDAGSAKTAADEAKAAADEAASKANTASSKADNAANKADAASGKADDALSSAESANQTAAAAQNVANSANQTANSANQAAANAQNTANSAQSTANSANQTANSAQSTANKAEQDAGDAKTAADEAKTAADSAASKADSADQKAETAKRTASSALNAAYSAVAKVDVEYYLSTSTTELIGGTWQTVAPPWEDGKYMWQMTTTTYKNGNTTTSDPTCIAGATGQTGAPGQTTYLHIKYSNDGGATFTGNYGEVVGDYIGQYVDYTAADSLVPSRYTWAKIKGEQGIPGVGENGKNGETSYLHIKYSNDGGATFTGSNGEVVGDYIGQYVDFEKDDSPEPSRYTWAKIKGEQGDEGLRSYFHIKYSNVPNPTSASQMWEDPDLYIGTYSDYTFADSTDPSKYKWARFQGLQGAEGVGVTAVTEEYYKSTSSLIQTGGTWLPYMPEWEEGYYIWTRTKVEYTEGDPGYTDPYLDTTANMAGDAASKADAANQTANSANQTAAAAQNAANSANQTATQAKDTADGAAAKADAADQKAGAAMDSANGANQAAVNAQNTARSALEIAQEAVSKDDFQRVVRVDTEGLHVGDNLTKCEVLIDSASVNVVYNDEKLATFSDTFVRLKDMIIKNTGDGLSISAYGV